MTKAADPRSSPGGATQAPGPVEILGIAGIPEVPAGADLAGLIADAAGAPGGPGLRDGDILVVTSKIVKIGRAHV